MSQDDRITVLIASYNTNLQAERGLPQDLVDWLSPTLDASALRIEEVEHPSRAPDIVAVGFQELLPLHWGFAGLSKSVIEDRNALILSQIEAHAPNKEKYSLIAKVVNVGVALLVYGRDDGVARRVCDVQTQWTGCGPAYLGNKGAVGVRFRVAGKEGEVGEVYTFVCAHLTAHGYNLHRRIEDYHQIVGTLLFPPSLGSEENEPSTIFDTSHLFFFGDLNFRLDIPSSHPLGTLSHDALTQKLGSEADREALKDFDQLRIERDERRSCFVGFREGEFWKFKCSYKYRLGEVETYDRKRAPAWTDRIMYTTHTDDPVLPQDTAVESLLYTSIPSYTTSDHKPIVSLLLLPPVAPATPATQPPQLRLPHDYTPRPDPYAIVKRYTGRVLGRILGYIWCLFTLVGAGSTVLGIGNFILGLSAWGWWRSRSPVLP